MPLDAVIVTALRRELDDTLTGARVDRISMPERDQLILSLRSRENGNTRLLISLRPGSARVHLTRHSFENPAQPPMFCMLLRKHLLGAHVTAVEQPPNERLLLLRFDTVDELNYHKPKTLAAELMGKGVNLILVGEDGRIIDCLRRVDYETNARRAVLPGLFYETPPAQDKPPFFALSEEELNEYFASADRGQESDRWLLETFGGLSPLLCRELALNGWDGVRDAALSLRRRVETGDLLPVMLTENGRPRDFCFMPVKQYGQAAEQETYPDFCTLLDEFYTRRDQQENLRRHASDLTKLVKTSLSRLRRKTAAREQELLDTEKREEYRRRGDLITANIYRLKRGMESFEATDYFEESCPTVVVPLDSRKTPQQNAAASYKLYNKAKTANRILTELISASREEEAYLESVLHELQSAESETDVREIRSELVQTGYIRNRQQTKGKKTAARGPMRFRSPSGTEILVGRGNIQNDELTFRTAYRGDLWLHVQKLPGSHVIVSQRHGEADEETIRMAADLAVTFSGAADGERAAVDCTLVRNVKKTAGAKPGRVIYTDYKTIAGRSDHTMKVREETKQEYR